MCTSYRQPWADALVYLPERNINILLLCHGNKEIIDLVGFAQSCAGVSLELICQVNNNFITNMVCLHAHARYTGKLKKQQPRRKPTDYLTFQRIHLAAYIMHAAQLN